MTIQFKKNFFNPLNLFLLTLLIFVFFNVTPLWGLENPENVLVEKISKDYTKKFCNGVAFGLSKDSAMKFAIKENFMVFEKKKGINSINKELISNKIAVSVVDTCGYPLDLKGEKGIKEFEKDYLLMSRDLLKEK